jgi:hypothetical protein
MVRPMIVVCALLLCVNTPHLLAAGRTASGFRTSHTLELYTLLHSVDYKEDFPPPGKSEESGWLAGIGFACTFQGQELPLWGTILMEYTPSGTDYDGVVQNWDGTVAPYRDKTKNIFKRLELDGGYTLWFLNQGRLSLTPYTGYGYRFWRRSLPGGEASYEEDYSWNYIPFGVKGEYFFDPQWSVALDVAMRIMFGGQIEIKRPDFGTPTLDLGSVLGWKFALPVSVRLNREWSVAFTTWYDYSGISESQPHFLDQQQYIKEPSSTTNQFGFDIRGRFHF